MFLLFFGLLFVTLLKGERFRGVTKQNDRGFGYIAKFCFDVNHDKSDLNNPVGMVDVTISSPKIVPDLVFMLFDDQAESWPQVYENEGLTCEEVQQKSKFLLDVIWDGSNTSAYTWSIARTIHQNLRPRFWYVAVGSCETEFIDISYSAHLTQLQDEVSWNKEFGINVMGLNTLYLVFFFFYFGFIVVHSIGTYRLRKQLEYTHPLVRLFFSVLIIQFLMVIARMLHYGIFASNGVGVPALNKFAEVAEAFARVGFVIILMLLAKGWTIKNEQLTGRKWILTFAFLFLFADVAILFWRYAIQNPAATNIPLGFAFMLYSLLFVWFLWFFWFAYAVFHSWKNETNPPKKKLFLLLAVIYLPWFFGLPFVTLLKFALDPWVRQKFVAIFSMLISTVGYSFLSFLLWPTRAQEYFAITSPDPMNAGISNYEQL